MNCAQARIIEEEREYVLRVGRRRPEADWVLSDRDVWYPNPFFQGVRGPDPESHEAMYGEEDAYYCRRCDTMYFEPCDCEECGEPMEKQEPGEPVSFDSARIAVGADLPVSHDDLVEVIDAIERARIVTTVSELFPAWRKCPCGCGSGKHREKDDDLPF